MQNSCNPSDWTLSAEHWSHELRASRILCPYQQIYGEGLIFAHLKLSVKCCDGWSEHIGPGTDRGATVPVVCAPGQDA